MKSVSLVNNTFTFPYNAGAAGWGAVMGAWMMNEIEDTNL